MGGGGGGGEEVFVEVYARCQADSIQYISRSKLFGDTLQEKDGTTRVLDLGFRVHRDSTQLSPIKRVRDVGCQGCCRFVGCRVQTGLKVFGFRNPTVVHLPKTFTRIAAIRNPTSKNPKNKNNNTLIPKPQTLKPKP